MSHKSTCELFLLYISVVITLIYAPDLCAAGTRLILKPSRDESSDHWSRCRAILKQRETRSCTQSGGPSCTGRKISAPDEDGPGYWCNTTDSCPTVLSSLTATVYRADLLWTKPDWWYGVNISWTVNATGTAQDTEKKTFLIAAGIVGYNLVYYVEIDATLEETDYVNGKATLHYDCIYPISNNESYTLNINIKSKPHAYRDLRTTSVETMPSVLAVLTTPTSRPVEKANTTSGYDATTPSETSPATNAQAGIGRNGSAEQPSPPDNGKDGSAQQPRPPEPAVGDVQTQNPALLYGLFGGLLGVAVMCVSIFAVYKHWIHRQKNERLQKVVILAMNDDVMMKKLYKEFLRRLRRSFQCRIVNLHHISLESVVQPDDLIKAEMTSAFCIIVVTSQRILDVLARLESSFDGDQKSRDPSRVALAIIHRELRLSPSHMSKIVSVQFEGASFGPSIPYLSPWRCVSLPGGTDKLVKFLKGDRDSLEADLTDTMGTSEPTLVAGVQFSDRESLISSEEKMEESSWNVPRSLFGQKSGPNASHYPNPNSPPSHYDTQGHTQQHTLYCPDAQQNVLYNQQGHRQDFACMPSVDVVNNSCTHYYDATDALRAPQTVSWKPPVIPQEQSEIGSEAIEDMVYTINSGLF